MFNMAWRETRAAWRHFLYFLVCIAIGVGALTGVSLFGAQVERAVTKEARGLLGGDLEIRLSRLMSPKGQEVLDSLSDRGIALTHVSELVAMAARTGSSGSGQSTQIIELKAVESQYPLYGTLRLEAQSDFVDLLGRQTRRCPDHTCFGVVVQESLLIRMGLTDGRSTQDRTRSVHHHRRGQDGTGSHGKRLQPWSSSPDVTRRTSRS